MEWIQQFVELVLHLDEHLVALVHDYGMWAYGILFTIIFCETGLVVTPFLPGDSLLFAAGAVAATGALDPHALCALLAFAAVFADNVNYALGYGIGPVAFPRPASRLLVTPHPARPPRF